MVFTVASAGAHELQQQLEWFPRIIRLDKRPNGDGEAKCHGVHLDIVSIET